MLGAVIGDIAGSRFEWDNYRAKDFVFFHPDCEFTDDSVMTLAIAQAVLQVGAEPLALAQEAIRQMRKIGRHYPRCGFGGHFFHWIFGPEAVPYNSFGNGAAMRVSPVAWAAADLDTVLALSDAVTAISHDHPEGLKGARATTAAIFLARHGASQQEIREHIEAHYYPLAFTIDEIRPHYRFNETCQDTVPQAIEAFLEADGFEDAIRIAISLGGDSDTLGAITGSIAEAAFGIPAAMREEALGYLDTRLRSIAEAWLAAYPPQK